MPTGCVHVILLPWKDELRESHLIRVPENGTRVPRVPRPSMICLLRVRPVLENVTRPIRAGPVSSPALRPRYMMRLLGLQNAVANCVKLFAITGERYAAKATSVELTRLHGDCPNYQRSPSFQQ